MPAIYLHLGQKHEPALGQLYLIGSPTKEISKLMSELGELHQSSQAWLREFVQLSFDISGLSIAPSDADVAAHRGLLMCRTLAVQNIEVLASYVCPNGRWRTHGECGVRRGFAGIEMNTNLQASVSDLLNRISNNSLSAESAFTSFLDLRPLTDGNGRIGRALWLWRMTRSSSDGSELQHFIRGSSVRPQLH